ncbi:hypothetical protein [Streptomyces sp. NBC_00878]|nr:hypothetical protein [Streptomyces sp. NBC_00878]MCX4904423.1 hypothetical protein [Streptomyces sp. NBC_00878]
MHPLRSILASTAADRAPANGITLAEPVRPAQASADECTQINGVDRW